MLFRTDITLGTFRPGQVHFVTAQVTSGQVTGSYQSYYPTLEGQI